MTGPRRRIAGGAGALLILAGLVAADVQAGGGSQPKTLLVSRQSANAGGAGADSEASNPAISGSGRFVAFDTDADNLGGPLDTDFSNIYVYDRERKRVELISRRSRSAGGAGGNGGSFSPEISANGRYVAFSTDADNLGGPLDTDFSNIYVYDRELDKIRLVSRRSGRNGAGANEDSFSPALSRNGRFIAYETEATNLGGPLNTEAGFESNIYVYDLEKRKTRLASRRSGRRGQGANDTSFTATLSASGRLLAFSTEATNLGGPTGTAADEANIYVRNLKTNKTKLVSRRSGQQGQGGDGSSFDPFLAPNGRYIGFETESINLGGPITNDPAAGETNIYVYDLDRRKVALVSRDSRNLGHEGGDDDNDDPWLSRNGRFIAFETDSDNLHAAPNPGNTDGDNVYMYDRERKRVELIGRASGSQGEACDEDCEDPSVSYNGRFIAIEAEADNFGGPFDPATDNKIYVRDRGR